VANCALATVTGKLTDGNSLFTSPVDCCLDEQHRLDIYGFAAWMRVRRFGARAFLRSWQQAEQQCLKDLKMSEPRKEVNHLVFNVRNMDEAIKFYTEVLGMRVVMKFEDRKMAFLSFGDRLGDIRLFEVGATTEPDRQTLGFNHLAIEPDGGLEALEKLHQRLIDKGVKIDKLESHAAGRHKSVYFFDQDGNRLEFYWESPDWRKESSEMVRTAFGKAETPSK